MQITRLSIDNWRNFKHLDIAVSPRLIVVGPNASGKSNFLDVFRFLGELVEPGGGLAAAVEKRGGIGKIRSLFARNHRGGRAEIKVWLDDDGVEWEYFLSMRGEGKGRNRAFVAKETVAKDGVLILDRPSPEDLADPERLTQTHLEQISANIDFRPIYQRFGQTTYLHLVPQIIRDPRRATDVTNDPFGGDFIAQMNAVNSRTRSAWLKRMQKALQAAVPQFESLDIVVDSSGRPHLKAGYKNWRSTLANQTEADFSDGTLRLIGLLWALVKIPANGGTLLLEEPELSLSSEVVRVLPTVLAQAQRSKDAQIILTSHAPELIDDEGVSPSEVLVLTVTDDGSTGFILDERSDLVADIDDGIPASDVIRPFISPENLSEISKVSFSGGRL